MAAIAHRRTRSIPGAIELSAARAHKLFDANARLYLGISGDEFLRRWDRGDYKNEPFCMSRAMRVASLISLVRERSARKLAKRHAR